MMVPVRCFTCGGVIGQVWDEYNERVEAGEDAGKVLDDVGVKRYCCRQSILGAIDLIKEINKFKV